MINKTMILSGTLSAIIIGSIIAIFKFIFWFADTYPITFGWTIIWLLIGTIFLVLARGIYNLIKDTPYEDHD